MQFPQEQDQTQRQSIPPPLSPWRPPQMFMDSSYRGQPNQGAGGAPGVGGPGGKIKLPNLPRLGTQNPDHKNRNSNLQNGPSFAQIVQQAPQAPGQNTSAGKINNQRGSGKASGSISNTFQSGNSDSAAPILGSVNSQMMPKVDSSYGMSSLNTVLPGISNNGSKSADRSGTQPSLAIPRMPMLQNLSVDDRSNTPVAGTTATSSTATSGTTRQPEVEKYGLKSLMNIMESKNNDRASVIVGTDFSQSDLNLGSATGKLSQTFASPWQDTTKYPVISDYHLPACYCIDTVVPQQQKLQKFDEGALFYIFYTMPRDAMQEAAAVELTNRSWRYHKELKMWLTKDPLSEPIQTNNQEESGIYIFFDPASWKKVKREYILLYPDIA